MGRPVLLSAIALASVALAACGSEGISVDEGDPTRRGAELFAQRCSGCHTISAAGAQGSGNRADRVQGPDFDQRTVAFEDALFAIRNGGFSGAIMPQNIVTGEDAEAVARFIARHSGKSAETERMPGGGG